MTRKTDDIENETLEESLEANLQDKEMVCMRAIKAINVTLYDLEISHAVQKKYGADENVLKAIEKQTAEFMKKCDFWKSELRRIRAEIKKQGES